ncbi:MAG: hypothetical protein ACTSUE_14005 [Promethearchaeota archaeon]
MDMERVMAWTRARVMSSGLEHSVTNLTRVLISLRTIQECVQVTEVVRRLILAIVILDIPVRNAMIGPVESYQKTIILFVMVMGRVLLLIFAIVILITQDCCVVIGNVLDTMK